MNLERKQWPFLHLSDVDHLISIIQGYTSETPDLVRVRNKVGDWPYVKFTDAIKIPDHFPFIIALKGVEVKQGLIGLSHIISSATGRFPGKLNLAVAPKVVTTEAQVVMDDLPVSTSMGNPESSNIDGTLMVFTSLSVLELIYSLYQDDSDSDDEGLPSISNLSTHLNTQSSKTSFRHRAGPGGSPPHSPRFVPPSRSSSHPQSKPVGNLPILPKYPQEVLLRDLVDFMLHQTESKSNTSKADLIVDRGRQRFGPNFARTSWYTYRAFWMQKTPPHRQAVYLSTPGLTWGTFYDKEVAILQQEEARQLLSQHGVSGLETMPLDVMMAYIKSLKLKFNRPGIPKSIGRKRGRSESESEPCRNVPGNSKTAAGSVRVKVEEVDAGSSSASPSVDIKGKGRAIMDLLLEGLPEEEREEMAMDPDANEELIDLTHLD